MGQNQSKSTEKGLVFLKSVTVPFDIDNPTVPAISDKTDIVLFNKKDKTVQYYGYDADIDVDISINKRCQTILGSCIHADNEDFNKYKVISNIDDILHLELIDKIEMKEEPITDTATIQGQETATTLEEKQEQEKQEQEEVVKEEWNSIEDEIVEEPELETVEEQEEEVVEESELVLETVEEGPIVTMDQEDKLIINSNIIQAVIDGVLNKIKDQIKTEIKQEIERNRNEDIQNKIEKALERHKNRFGDNCVVYKPLELSECFRNKIKTLEPTITTIQIQEQEQGEEQETAIASKQEQESDSESEWESESESELNFSTDITESDWDDTDIDSTSDDDIESISDLKFAHKNDNKPIPDIDVKFEPKSCPSSYSSCPSSCTKSKSKFYEHTIYTRYCYGCNKYFTARNLSTKCPYCVSYNTDVIPDNTKIMQFTDRSKQCLRCLEIMDADFEHEICTLEVKIPRCFHTDENGTVVCLICEEMFNIDDIRGKECRCLLTTNYYSSMFTL